jgi:hypothetical protein
MFFYKEKQLSHKSLFKIDIILNSLELPSHKLRHEKRGAIIAQPRTSPSTRIEFPSLGPIPAKAEVSCRLLDVFLLSWNDSQKFEPPTD